MCLMDLFRLIPPLGLRKSQLSSQQSYWKFDKSTIIMDNPEPPRGFFLLDANKKLQVSSAEQFVAKLNTPRKVRKVKVVSIFGKTGDGKSYTFNNTFFNGNEVFSTSDDQQSCTLGVWAAFDPILNIICLDTEGLLGVSIKEDQRTRLLLKVLAVSDIVVYRTKAERLHSDMYTFLGGASEAYKKYFHPALHQVLLMLKAESKHLPSALGPSVIVFHETIYTKPLSESPEDTLRSVFSNMKLSFDGFRSLKYVGLQSKHAPTSFTEFRNAIRLELKDTKVRSARPPEVIYNTLKGLNNKFNSQLPNSLADLKLERYFTCQVKCQACKVGCTLSISHKSDQEEEQESHQNADRCKYEHQFQNSVYVCKQCNKNGQRVVVKIVYNDSCMDLLSYLLYGYKLNCKTGGVIYLSRKYWYGNKNPEEEAVIEENVHVWAPGEGEEDSIISDKCWEAKYRNDSKKWIVRDSTRKKASDMFTTSTTKDAFIQSELDNRPIIGKRRLLIQKKLTEEVAQQIIEENSPPQTVEEYCTEYNGSFNCPGYDGPDPDKEAEKATELYLKYPLYTSDAKSFYKFKLDRELRGQSTLSGLTEIKDVKSPFRKYSGFTKDISETLEEDWL